MPRGQWWERAGLPGDPGRGGLGLALRALHLGRRGPATDADRPPTSTLPMTPAAREAIRIRREQSAD